MDTTEPYLTFSSSFRSVKIPPLHATRSVKVGFSNYDAI